MGSLFSSDMDLVVFGAAAAVTGLLAAAIAAANGTAVRDALLLPPSSRFDRGAPDDARGEDDMKGECDRGVVSSELRYFELRGRTAGAVASGRPAGEVAVENQPRLRCLLQGGLGQRGKGGGRLWREARVLIGGEGGAAGGVLKTTVRMAADSAYDSARWMALEFPSREAVVRVQDAAGERVGLVVRGVELAS